MFKADDPQTESGGVSEFPAHLLRRYVVADCRAAWLDYIEPDFRGAGRN